MNLPAGQTLIIADYATISESHGFGVQQRERSACMTKASKTEGRRAALARARDDGRLSGQVHNCCRQDAARPAIKHQIDLMFEAFANFLRVIEWRVVARQQVPGRPQWLAQL